MNSISLQEQYHSRPIRFLELWQPDGWRIKVYGISYNSDLPRAELVQASKDVLKQHLPVLSPEQRHYGVGFMGVHDGRGSNFVFIDYWADENELHHHVYASPSEQAKRFEYITPGGLIACVWDLRLICFERDAWVELVLDNPSEPDLEAYLARRLNTDA